MKKTKNCGNVLKMVRSTYSTLTEKCRAKWPKPHNGLSHTDILHDTILRVMHDEKAQAITDDAEFVKYFLYRANVTIFQLSQNRKSEIKSYANYQTLKRHNETTTEED